MDSKQPCSPTALSALGKHGVIEKNPSILVAGMKVRLYTVFPLV